MKTLKNNLHKRIWDRDWIEGQSHFINLESLVKQVMQEAWKHTYLMLFEQFLMC